MFSSFLILQTKMSLLRLVKKRKKLICVVPRLSSGAGLWRRYRAAIVYAIIVVCLREFYAKPYSALEEKKSPCFVKFRSIFRTAAFVIVILPSALGISLEVVHRSGVVPPSCCFVLYI